MERDGLEFTFEEIYTDSWLYHFAVATITKRKTWPSPPVVRMFIFLIDDFTEQVTVVHQSLSRGGIWTDV